MTDIVFPGDANTLGTMFGGKMMALMDKAAFLAAVKYARVPFVTISSDGIQFLAPVHVGDIIETRARVAYVGKTSLVVKVEVYRELPFEDAAPVLATRDWFAMAARDEQDEGILLPPLIAESAEEIADEAQGRAFREGSLGLRHGRGTRENQT